MQKLVGHRFPAIALKSTTGELVDLSRIGGHCVLVCYPYSGRPGVPDPKNWDNIPGAHGSTPQILAYSAIYEQLRTLDVKLFGISLQSPEWQQELVQRCALRVRLLSDETRLFSVSLKLPTFETGGQTFLNRLTLLARDGTIIGSHEPAVPEEDAAQTLALFNHP